MINNFDIYVSKENDTYKAITSSFPMCEGTGNSQDEAIEDLGDDIAFYLEDKVYEIIEDTINNNKARLVTKHEQQVQRNRSNFKFSAELFNSPDLEKILKQLKKFSSQEQNRETNRELFSHDPISKLFDHLLGELEENGPSTTVVGFNIPISLN